VEEVEADSKETVVMVTKEEVNKEVAEILDLMIRAVVEVITDLMEGVTITTIHSKMFGNCAKHPSIDLHKYRNTRKEKTELLSN
jgi:hypothetical protein